ncbi:hypothetical protein ACFXKD_01275 [Nocardiopsis aegyptia]|uniref:hypothetical protein n=1 Tax=Nocardiopsis aegyptia TaxID=220378 RepID=UPI00366E8678
MYTMLGRDVITPARSEVAVSGRARAGARSRRPVRRRATPGPDAEPVRFDWYDPSTHGAVLQSADRAVLLSSSALPEVGPGVGRVHSALPALFEFWAVLRPSWFMQNFTGAHAHAVTIREHGTLDRTTDTVRRLTGRPPNRFRAVAARETGAG